MLTDHRPELFIGLAKVQTFRRACDALRSAVYASGDDAVLAAWRNFERWTDCINPNPKGGDA